MTSIHQHPPSIMTRFAARLTGTSVDALAEASDDEHKTVRHGGLTLLIISALATLGWFIALGIARGEMSLDNLPPAALAGVIIFAIDRAMLRRLWSRAGHKSAERRGFPTDAPEGWFGWASHFLLRVAVSLVLSLTTASFIELEVFRTDTEVQIASDNRAQNDPISQAMAERADANILAKRDEIERLDAQAARVLDDASRIDEAGRSARIAQLTALTTERDQLQQQIRELTSQLACETQNRAAEENGQVRCDGLSAVAGTGDRFDFAEEMADFARQERDAATTRVQQIDAALERLQSSEEPGGISTDARDLLNQIAVRRAQVMSDLERLTADREENILAGTLAHPDYVPLPDGLIVRGEALGKLAETSPWLQTRILLVFLTLLVLDMGAILVMSIMPAPKSVVFNEVLSAEVVMREAQAKAEKAIAEASKTIFEAREQTARTEEEADERITRLHTARKTRQAVNARVDEGLDERFREAS